MTPEMMIQLAGLAMLAAAGYADLTAPPVPVAIPAVAIDPAVALLAQLAPVDG